MKSLLTSMLLIFGIACSQVSAADGPAEPYRSDLLINAVSEYDFAETDRRIEAAIEARGLVLFAIVDHASGAESVDETLKPSKLYIFGNPKAGTPLMQSNAAFGIELPMKIHVYEEENGDVIVSRFDVIALTSDYGISGKDALLDNIGKALSGIVDEATAP